MIDPDQLRSQRRRLGVAVERPSEYRCPRCDRRTRDRSGICIRCKGASIPDLSKLATDDLTAWQTAIRNELQRRRDILDAALRGAA